MRHAGTKRTKATSCQGPATLALSTKMPRSSRTQRPDHKQILISERTTKQSKFPPLKRGFTLVFPYYSQGLASSSNRESIT